jgi:hypothetical protein
VILRLLAVLLALSGGVALATYYHETDYSVCAATARTTDLNHGVEVVPESYLAMLMGGGCLIFDTTPPVKIDMGHLAYGVSNIDSAWRYGMFGCTQVVDASYDYYCKIVPRRLLSQYNDYARLSTVRPASFSTCPNQHLGRWPVGPGQTNWQQACFASVAEWLPHIRGHMYWIGDAWTHGLGGGIDGVHLRGKVTESIADGYTGTFTECPESYYDPACLNHPDPGGGGGGGPGDGSGGPGWQEGQHKTRCDGTGSLNIFEKALFFAFEPCEPWAERFLTTAQKSQQRIPFGFKGWLTKQPTNTAWYWGNEPGNNFVDGSIPGHSRGSFIIRMTNWWDSIPGMGHGSGNQNLEFDLLANPAADWWRKHGRIWVWWSFLAAWVLAVFRKVIQA